MQLRLIVSVVLIGMATCACSTGRKSSLGFHMPDGDVERGRVAFADLRCNSCHQVAGESFPAPIADPPVPVVLGGIVIAERTDGELAGSIIDPSHRIVSAYPSVSIHSGSLSRMGDFSEVMTVQQLQDLVAFLHSRYEVRRPSPDIR